MKEFTYTITDPEGIHARPAGELVKAAKAFESAIKLNKEGKSADCRGKRRGSSSTGNGEFLQDNSVTL